MLELYEETLARRRYLEKKGYRIVECWECEYERELKTNPTMRQYVDQINITEALNPRHAFFGGRTNAIKLYHEAEGEEKIRYYDVCSLYPWVNKV